MDVINRHIYKAIREYQSKYPILAVTGPRQSGKTTLLKTLFPDYRYVSLENPDARDFALRDPNGFLAEYNDFMIFDEVQQAPALFSYLQTLVDSRPERMGGFILSGSQNFHLSISRGFHMRLLRLGFCSCYRSSPIAAVP